MTFRLILIVFVYIFSSFIFTGCNNDPLLEVEQYTSTYDFTTALELLNSLDSEEVDSLRLYHLTALSLLVEGKLKSGFALINRTESYFKDSKYAEERYKTAQVLKNAAEVLIREQDRVDEAIMVMDSALARDPALKEEISSLVWTRGIEYISIRGRAGYDLFNFMKTVEPGTIGRLRGYNKIFQKRFEDMRDVDYEIRKLVRPMKDFKKKFKRNPKSLVELLTVFSKIPFDMNRKGWNFYLTPKEGILRIAGETNDKHPLKIPTGTILYAP